MQLVAIMKIYIKQTNTYLLVAKTQLKYIILMIFPLNKT